MRLRSFFFTSCFNALCNMTLGRFGLCCDWTKTSECGISLLYNWPSYRDGEILQRGSFLRFNPTCAVGREQCSLNTKMSFATVDLASQLRALRKDCDRDGDFVLTCQGRDIKAHSFILSMRSGPSNKILFIGLNPFFSGVNTSGLFSPPRLDASPR